MKSRGHEFFIAARDKEVAHKLLEAYHISYLNRGKGANALLGKFLYIFKADHLLFKHAQKFEPDLFLSFASPYAAHVSKLLKKPHITFDDTEHAKLSHMLYAPFTDVILSPSCFYAPFSEKQIFFDAYMEMCYLHPKYFTPKREIFSYLNIPEDQKYVILRFVSWDANHDIGQSGLTYDTKKKLIKELAEYAKIFISSETVLPLEFEKFRLKISPQYLHDVLSFAALYVGEGSTTASECSVLGTPNIYVNSLKVGYCREQEDKYKICRNFETDKGVVEEAVEILQDEYLKKSYEITPRKCCQTKYARRISWFGLLKIIQVAKKQCEIILIFNIIFGNDPDI